MLLVPVYPLDAGHVDSDHGRLLRLDRLPVIFGPGVALQIGVWTTLERCACMGIQRITFHVYRTITGQCGVLEHMRYFSLPTSLHSISSAVFEAMVALSVTLTYRG